MILLFFVNSGSLVHGQTVYRENKLKAVFLYNFAKFVTWPDNAFENSQSPIVIGVLGEGPLVEALKSVEGKTAQDRRVDVKKFNTEEDIDICHILYISSSQNARLDQVLSSGFLERNILTVGSTKQFTKSGVVINFFKEKNKLKFEISRKSAERAHLTLSSKLLSLAIITD